MDREAAYNLLKKHLTTPNLIKHCVATEAIMRELALRFNEEKEMWGITGLLHDLDLDILKGDLSKHGKVAAKLAEEEGLEKPYVQAIIKHPASVIENVRRTTLEHALSAAETITGLIVATALVYPDKKLAGVKAKSIRKRFKEPRFAAGADRDHIRECEMIDIELPEFIDISLNAMKKIASEIGL